MKIKLMIVAGAYLPLRGSKCKSDTADSACDYRHGLNKAIIRYNIRYYKADIEYN